VKNSTLNQERDIKGQMERIQSIKILWTIRRTIRSRSIFTSVDANYEDQSRMISIPNILWEFLVLFSLKSKLITED
jgi:hypothetical protein